MHFLDVQSTFAAADSIRKRYRTCEAQGLDPRRAIDGASINALLSMVVLLDQLDRIAQAAALYAAHDPQFDAWTELQEQLAAAGYLPLPAPAASPDIAQKEPAHGEG